MENEKKDATQGVIDSIVEIGERLKKGEKLTLADFLSIFIEHTGDHIKDVRFTGTKRVKK